MATAINAPIQLGLFPAGPEAFGSLYRFYDYNKPIAFTLLISFFIVRSASVALYGGGSREYGDLFRDLLFTTIALIGFTSFLDMVSHIPDLMIHQFQNYHEVTVRSEAQKWPDQLMGYLNSASDIVVVIVSLIVAIFYFLLMGTACVLGPFIILMSVMGRQIWLLKTLIVCLILSSLWPVFWYLINVFMKQTMAHETVFKSMLIFILGSLAKLGFPGLLLMTVKQSMGVSGAMKETSSVLSKVSAASGVGGRAAAVATSSLGGGHYVESLRTMASGLKGSGLGVLGRTIPTLESIGSKSLSGLTRGISAIAPNPVKDKVRKVGETKNLALSNIKRTSGKVQSYFQGSNPEAFSLGSPIGKKSLGGTASAKGGGGRNSFDQGQRSSNFAAKPSFYNSSAGATPRTPGSNGGYASLKRSNQRRGNDGGITERQKYV